jgi:hypothetical protein
MSTPEQAFANYYASMSDEEILRIAANQQSLLPVAQAALRAELTTRRGRGLIVPVFEKKKHDPGRRWWPAIWDADSAKKASRDGASAAYFVGGLTGILAVASMFTPLKIVEPSALVDAVIALILGFLIHRKMSRTAAVGAFVMFVAERVYAAIEHGMSAAIGVLSLVLLAAFISGVRGTFAYQSDTKAHASTHFPDNL